MEFDAVTVGDGKPFFPIAVFKKGKKWPHAVASTLGIPQARGDVRDQGGARSQEANDSSGDPGRKIWDAVAHRDALLLENGRENGSTQISWLDHTQNC